jgi:hypothetical protein
MAIIYPGELGTCVLVRYAGCHPRDGEGYAVHAGGDKKGQRLCFPSEDAARLWVEVNQDRWVLSHHWGANAA